MNIIEKICKSTVIYITATILFVLGILGLIYTTNVIGPWETVDITCVSIISLVIFIFLIIIYLFIIKKISKIELPKVNNKIIIAILLLLYAIISIVWINVIDVKPIDDSATVHNIAVIIYENNIDTLKNSIYLEKCPQQIGMSLFFALIYKIFHTTNYQIIQYLNILANILTILGLYKITKKINSKNKLTYIIYFSISLLFIPLLILSTYVYSDYIGLALVVWAIYFIMNYKEKEKYKDIIISAIMMCIACIIKTNYLVSFIAIIIYLILNIITNNKEVLKKIILVVMYSLIILVPYISIKTIVAEKLDLVASESIPTTGYLYLGMSESDIGAGWYGTAIQPAWDDATKSREVYPTLIKERLKEFLSNPLYCIKFYTRKIVSGWEDPLFQSLWYNVTPINNHADWNYIMSHPVYIIASMIMKAILMLLYVFVLFYMIMNRKKINNESLLLAIIFIGGFLFHFLWEMKSRYTLPYIIILIPLATIGINQFIELINTKEEVSKKTKL